jgi:uncharacterized protein
MKLDSAPVEFGWFRAIISRSKVAKLLVFGLVLLAALISLQLLIGLVAHRLGGNARLLWLLPAKLVIAVIMLWLYSKFVRYFERRAVDELALRGAPYRAAMGLILGSGLFCTVIVLLSWGGYVQAGAFAGLSVLASQLCSSLGAAVGEEIVFRGAIFRIAEEWLGTTAALVFSALLFALAHGVNAQATPANIGAIALESGVLLGAAYVASRSLWFPIGIHFGWNFTEGGVFGTALWAGGSRVFGGNLDGPALVSGGALVPSIVAVGVCLAATAVLCVYGLRRGHWRRWRLGRIGRAI